MLDITPATLRFWEKEFDGYIQPKKTKKGDRHYTSTDINKLKYIYHLLKEKKYTIEGCRQVLHRRQKNHNPFELIERLEHVKQWLQEMGKRL